MKSSFAIIAILLILPIAAMPQSKEAKQYGKKKFN